MKQQPHLLFRSIGLGSKAFYYFYLAYKNIEQKMPLCPRYVRQFLYVPSFVDSLVEAPVKITANWLAKRTSEALFYFQGFSSFLFPLFYTFNIKKSTPTLSAHSFVLARPFNNQTKAKQVQPILVVAHYEATRSLFTNRNTNHPFDIPSWKKYEQSRDI